MGTRLDRDHHRQAPRGEGESAGRRGDGARGVEPRAVRRRGHAAALRAEEPCRDTRAIPRRQESAGVVRHGRLGRHRLLQHGRGGEAGAAQARIVEGPHQAGLQGQDRDAEPGVVRHRLLRRDRLAAAVGRSRRLEIHGRAAREHRPVHAFGQQAVRAGRQRRIPDRHLVRISRQHDQGEGRPDRPRLPDRRPGLGSRGVRHHEEHQEARRREGVRRLDRRRRKRTSSSPPTSRSSRFRASPSRCRTSRRITRSGW